MIFSLHTVHIYHETGQYTFNLRQTATYRGLTEVLLNVLTKTVVSKLMKPVRCHYIIPGFAHLQTTLEGFVVQGEEYLLKNVGHSLCEQFVNGTGIRHGNGMGIPSCHGECRSICMTEIRNKTMYFLD